MNYVGPHPAAGFGNLTRGWLLTPYNPLSPGTQMVASLSAAAPGQMLRIRGTGELMAGQFVLPQNPILDAIGRGVGRVADLTPGAFPVPMNPIMAGRSGMGCDCGGGCNGMGALGDSVSDAVSGWLNEDSPITGVSNLTFWGLGLAALFVFSEVRGATYGKSRR